MHVGDFLKAAFQTGRVPSGISKRAVCRHESPLPTGLIATVNSPLVGVSGSTGKRRRLWKPGVCLRKTSRALSGDLPGSAGGGRAPQRGMEACGEPWKRQEEEGSYVSSRLCL